uniref:Uncharacterized protein n=1 Tax=Serratia phage Kevin TaxID=3161161 RepID=A0AAU8KX38_9CAUD
MTKQYTETRFMMTIKDGILRNKPVNGEFEVVNVHRGYSPSEHKSGYARADRDGYVRIKMEGKPTYVHCNAADVSVKTVDVPVDVTAPVILDNGETLEPAGTHWGTIVNNDGAEVKAWFVKDGDFFKDVASGLFYHKDGDPLVSNRAGRKVKDGRFTAK